MSVDICLNSNNASALVRSSLEASTKNLAYMWPTTYPNVVKNISRVSPEIAVSGDPASKQLIFNIPRGGFLRSMFVETKFTPATGAILNTTNNVGTLYLFDELRLVTGNGQNIHSISGDYVFARTKCSDFYTRMRTEYNAALLDGSTYERITGASTSTTEYACINPFYSPMDQVGDPTKSLDLGIVEQLKAQVTYSTLARTGFVGGATTIALAGSTTTNWLDVFTHYFDDVAQRNLRSQNYAPGKRFSMLCWNQITERAAAAVSAANTFRMNHTYPVSDIYCFVRNNTAGNFATVPINSFDFKVGGTALYPSSLPRGVMNLDCAAYESPIEIAATGNTLTVAINKPLHIKFGFLGTNDMMSGVLSFGALSTPTFTLNTATLAVTQDLVVVSQYYNIWDIAADTGRVALGLQF